MSLEEPSPLAGLARQPAAHVQPSETSPIGLDPLWSIGAAEPDVPWGPGGIDDWGWNAQSPAFLPEACATSSSTTTEKESSSHV